MKDFIYRKTLGLFVKTNGYLSKKLFGGLGHIFILHRVLPANQREQHSLTRDLAITPEHLEWCIEYLKKNNYDFISLDELHRRLVKGIAFKKRVAVLTLDDGYRDNIVYGLPVFKKHNVPATIFVTNCFPDGTAVFWWYLLEDAMKNVKQFAFRSPRLTEIFEWETDIEQRNAFNKVGALIIGTPKNEFAEMIRQTFGQDADALREPYRQMPLSWSELKELVNEPLITIGAHTLNHYGLACLSYEEASNEITKSKFQLEEQLGIPVNHFAYPYGRFNEAGLREYKLAQQAGFKTSVINYSGNIFSSSKNNLHCLPRAPLGNSVTEERLKNIISGIEHFSFHGFHRNVILPAQTKS